MFSVHRYAQYHADELSSQSLGEEKDLQVYVRAAKLAGGDEVDQLLGSQENSHTWGNQVTEDVARVNAQFYETWLKT